MSNLRWVRNLLGIIQSLSPFTIDGVGGKRVEFVTEWIAIGDRHNARNIRILKETQIEAVLCVADWVRIPRKRYVREEILCHKFSLRDSRPLPEDQRAELFAALGFLDEMVAQRRRCLIHCSMGISRSPAVLAAWLHTRLGLSWEEALDRIRSVRPIINPHPDLFMSIQQTIDRKSASQ